jgi:hypothetical protein
MTAAPMISDRGVGQEMIGVLLERSVMAQGYGVVFGLLSQRYQWEGAPPEGGCSVATGTR